MEIKHRLIFIAVYGVLLVMFLVGFSAPYWTIAPFDDVDSFGLWKTCANGRCFVLTVTDEWMQATQAMMCLALISVLVTGVAFMASFRYAHSEWPRRTACLSAMIAGVLGLIGEIIYYAEHIQMRVSADGWALVLTCVTSGLLVVFGAAVGCVGLRKSVDIS